VKRLLALTLLVVAGWAQPPAPGSPAEEPKPLTIEAIAGAGGITGRGPETLEWSPDSSRVSFIQRDAGENGELWYLDAATGKQGVLVSADKLGLLAPPVSKLKSEQQKEAATRYAIAGYHWAPDSRHLLFDSQGQLWLYSLETSTATQITSVTDPISDPKFSPDGRRIAYLLKHDLYVQAPGKGRAVRLTKDGSNNLLNGEVDWVYEEELDVRSNYFWSPDGQKILFLQMDESQVPTYPIEDFLPTHPTLYMEKYPKAGDPNPAVRLGVVGAAGGKVKWLAVPAEARREEGSVPDDGFYIPRFGWVRPGLAYVQVLNRAQNQLDLYFVDAESGRSRRVLRESSKTWVDVNNDFQVLKSGDRFLWSSDRDGHQHLYLYSFDQANPLGGEAKLERQLTRGDFDVAGVEGVEEGAGMIYVVANAGDARQRQIYSLKLDGSGWRQVSQGEGTHSAEFAPDARHYIAGFSGLLTPPRTSVCAPGGACFKLWESKGVAAYGLIEPRFVDFKADDGTQLQATLILPPGATPEHKAPLIMNPYGGPQAQLVRNAWGGPNFLFDEILAKQGFAILVVDNRGMAGRGKKFAEPIFRNFGETELKDQLAALHQALERFPQLDGSRLGWWGWSYGGYMTLYALTHSDLFRAGVSVAPVTDWRDYDSIYTERYMGVPRENEAGYQKSSPVNSAAGLQGRLLILHGTGDDNVHFQNTVQMVDALIAAGQQFDLMFYPGKTHGISGKASRSHLYHLIQDHFQQALMGH
jgi:dipeptidyl-peptidase-4